MQQKEDHSRACLIMSYSTAAREYATNGFINMELRSKSEQELKPAHQNATEEMVKKKRNTSDHASSDWGAGFPTTSPIFLKPEKCQLIHHNFTCWGSVPAVHLAIMLACMQKIAVRCSELEGVVRGTTVRSATVEALAAFRGRAGR